MGEISYLTLDDVVGLQDAILERTGSPSSPLLHPDRLTSALARPRNAAWYEGADLIRQAVMLAVGISQSQAFLDGNKRAAFAAADVFLRINGLVYGGDPMELARRLERTAEASAGEGRDAETDELESWIRRFAEPTGPE